MTIVFGACRDGTSEHDDPPESERVRFTDVSGPAGLGTFKHVNGARGDVWFPETMGSGAGFFYYDDDAYPDLALVAGGTWPPDTPVQALYVFRNQGDGTFRDVSAEAGLSDLRAYGMGIAAADYDNDGDQDLYLTSVGENVLLRNDEGTFIDVTAEAGVGGGDVWSTSTLFFDADRDGWVDLLVGNYVVWSPEAEIPCPRGNGELAYCTPELYSGIAPHYFRNRGDGSFEDLSRPAGFAPSPGKTLGLVEFDFNEDGWPDVAFANDTEADQLFVNQGNGTFVEQGLLAGIAFDEQGKARAGMGIDAGDVEGEGRVSLFVGNFASEMISVFRHEGEGLFTDRAAVSQIGAASLPSLTFGLFLFDADLDGDLDLFAANGHIDPEIERFRDNSTHRQRANLFLNDGSGRFRDEAASESRDDALATQVVARGAAYADVDLDGDVDILVTENDGGAYLWRNEVRPGESGEPSFLRVRLRGTRANRDALGATVDLITTEGRQARRVHSGGSYLSASETAVTFGLSHVDTVDTLVVTWPDGSSTMLEDVQANRMLELVEGEGDPRQ